MQLKRVWLAGAGLLALLAALNILPIHGVQAQALPTATLKTSVPLPTATLRESAPPLATGTPILPALPTATLRPARTPTTPGGGYPPLPITPVLIRRGLDVRAFYDPLYVQIGTQATGRLHMLVNSLFGPVEEIPESGIALLTFVSPPDFGCIMAIESIFGGVKGIYGINFRPYHPTQPFCHWRAGRYVLILIVTRGDAEGTTFVEFEVR